MLDQDGNGCLTLSEVRAASMLSLLSDTSLPLSILWEKCRSAPQRIHARRSAESWHVLLGFRVQGVL